MPRDLSVKRLVIIGIGTGDPDHVTVQAVRALNQVDVFFIVDKRRETAALVELRREICRRHITDRAYRWVEIADSPRDESTRGYEARVVDWHRDRAERWGRAIDDELGDGECGGFLVWGDPGLYDSTLRVVEQIADRPGTQLDYEVVPGISSVQVLAARHRIPLNRIGEAVHVTTGRNLRAGLPDGVDNVVVMLDGELDFTSVTRPEEVDIYWGAYLGTADEVLCAGPLTEVEEKIRRIRTEARAAHGWIMDTYLLRRRVPRSTP